MGDDPLVGAYAHITGRLEQPGAFRLDDERAIRTLMTMPGMLGALSGEKNKVIADLAGAAYQVIGVIASAGGLFDHPDVQRALDYFADPVGEILPFSITGADS